MSCSNAKMFEPTQNVQNAKIYVFSNFNAFKTHMEKLGRIHKSEFKYTVSQVRKLVFIPTSPNYKFQSDKSCDWIKLYSAYLASRVY